MSQVRLQGSAQRAPVTMTQEEFEERFGKPNADGVVIKSGTGTFVSPHKDGRVQESAFKPMRSSRSSGNLEYMSSAKKPRAQVVKYDNNDSMFTELRTKASRHGTTTIKKGYRMSDAK